MDQVEYTLLCERIIALGGGLAFFGICALLGFADPSQTQIYLGLFLVCLAILTFAVISMFCFWWVFSIKKQILDIDQVNKLLFRSSTISVAAVLVVVLNFTGNLNPLNLLLLALGIVFYYVWI